MSKNLCTYHQILHKMTRTEQNYHQISSQSDYHHMIFDNKKKAQKSREQLI